jgi:hypothetical protein
MPLDKELYRKAYESLRQWNEAELLDRVRNPSKLTSQEAWRLYLGLWEFCMKLAPTQSELQRKRRLAEWDEYYARVRKLEAWRRANGKSSGETTPGSG